MKRRDRSGQSTRTCSQCRQSWYASLTLICFGCQKRVCEECLINSHYRTCSRGRVGYWSEYCLRCQTTPVYRPDYYCRECLKEIVPYSTPPADPKFRFGRSSLYGNDQDDPLFDNVIRLIEDG